MTARPPTQKITMSQTTKEAVKAALMPIAAEMAEVETIIAAEMASGVGRVEEIGRYITSAGGKRMRPALLLLMARAMGADPHKAAYLGAVIEILHTATLMHDDVVDEGMMRRGRETANAKWGNGPAVLVGDFLYTRSFQMMVRQGNLRVMQALADAANRLSEGEVLQMGNAHDPNVDEARYFAVIERKTACLFEASPHISLRLLQKLRQNRKCMCTVRPCAGKCISDCRRYSRLPGDCIRNQKNLGADLREGKVTLPVIYAMQNCSPAEKTIIEEAIRQGHGDFEAISQIVIKSGALEKCHQRAEVEAEKGKKAISLLPAGLFRESLVKFLTFAVDRDR